MNLPGSACCRGSIASVWFIRYLSIWAFLLLLGSTAADVDDAIPFTKLANGTQFPLVGLGVGNLQRDLIKDRIMEAVQQENNIVLFDTAQASKNEKLVRESIKNGLKKASSFFNKKSTKIHVITKVWYTHLGYERTKLSVQGRFDLPLF